MTAEKERPTGDQEKPERKKIPTLFEQLREKREEQLEGLGDAFKKSFMEYWEDRKKKEGKGKYPDLQTHKDVESYIGARRILWSSIQRLDMVLKDVARVALEILEDLKRKE